jgi:hypothetical protein
LINLIMTAIFSWSIFSWKDRLNGIGKEFLPLF